MAGTSAAIQAEAQAQIESFRWHEVGLRELTLGPVTADLVRRGIRVMNAAKYGWSTSSPSAPGEKPANVTGRARASITWRLGVDAFSPYVDVGSNVIYTAFLELGTSRMAARPFLRPALEAARVTF